MTATTIHEIEGTPAAYPDRPAGLSIPKAAWEVNPRAVWQRIEAFTAYRWSPRGVPLHRRRPGLVAARLQPFVATTTERWQAGAWSACTLDPTPLGGLELPGCGPHRITGTAGTAEAPPEAVLEAYRRLAEYMAGAIGADVNMAATAEQEGDYRVERPASWLSRAMQHSGAADLLRPYRGLGAS